MVSIRRKCSDVDALVEVNNLSFEHRQGGHSQRVLNDLTLKLNPGELVVLKGLGHLAHEEDPPAVAALVKAD